MPKHPAKSFRLPPATVEKLADLCMLDYLSQTAAIVKAIDRLHDVDVMKVSPRRSRPPRLPKKLARIPK